MGLGLHLYGGHTMASPSQNDNVYFGAATPNTFVGEYNRLIFIVKQALGKVRTATVVEVVACTNIDDASPVGLVDVKPLVNQIDGNFNSWPHGTVYGLPYLRIQGGTNAIIIDPVPGDIGICVFADRDISKVKTTKKQSAPGSLREFDFADGMYLGGILNGAPQNYIQFKNNSITIKANSIIIDSNLTVNGTITATGDVTANGTSVHTHTHGGVQTGSGNTGAPN